MNSKQIIHKILMRKKALTISAISAAVLIAAIAFIYAGVRTPQSSSNAAPLTQEQLIKLIKPSVVRIIQHQKGTLSVPDIDVNPQTLEITAAATKPYTRELDEYISGSGSIVTPDGYILTNSHVVSQAAIKRELVYESAQQLAREKVVSLGNEERARLFPDEHTYQAYVEKVFWFLYQNAKSTVKQEITVLNPSSGKRRLNDLLAKGFPAEIVSVNDDFALDQRDVAIIKINQASLPSLKLSPHNNVSVGDKIYVFGFPSTAEFNDQNFSESTLTAGVISAAKYNDDKNFKVYQTDAKISQGSSGGPMFNDQGEVIGLVTFETGEEARAAGDNFAFAIPISLGREAMEKKQVTNVHGDYAEHFKQALTYINRKECKAALGELTIAKTSNNFFATDQYIKPYQEQCQEMVEQGKSVDSWWAKNAEGLKTLSSLAWFVVIGRILLLLVGGLAFWLIIERLHKDEQQISRLEAELEDTIQEKTLVNFGTPLPLPEENVYSFSHEGAPLPHSDLVKYIREAKAVGLTESLIAEDLRKSGWKESDINNAFKHI